MVGAIQIHVKQMLFLVIDCILVEDIKRYRRIKEEIEGIPSFSILVNA